MKKVHLILCREFDSGDQLSLFLETESAKPITDLSIHHWAIMMWGWVGKASGDRSIHEESNIHFLGQELAVYDWFFTKSAKTQI